MKKLFLSLSLLGLIISGAAVAGAQYYNTQYYNTTTANMGYYGSMHTTHYPSTSYHYSHGAAVGSYTIGCTTYYYNMTTGAHLGSENICRYSTPAVYIPPVTQPVVYSNPSYTTYTDYYSYTYPSTQNCTWGYYNGMWRCSTNSMYGGGYHYSDGYQNYLNCYYDQYGQYICW